MDTRHTTLSLLSPCLLFALCAAVFALPEAAPALTGTGTGGDSKCVRFKAGREVKSGVCEWTLGITNEYDVRFTDEEGEAGMGYGCAPNRAALSDKEAGKLPRCRPLVLSRDAADRRDCAETDVMPGERCAFTLDGKPAALPENPPLPAGLWFCLEKTGTDEAMCMRRGETAVD